MEGENPMMSMTQIKSLDLIKMYTQHIEYLINVGIDKKTKFGNIVTVKMISNIVKRRDYLRSKFDKTSDNPSTEEVLNNILIKEGLK
jgi:hypothetical protein